MSGRSGTSSSRLKILGVPGSSGDKKDASKDNAGSYRPRHYAFCSCEAWPRNARTELAHALIPTGDVGQGPGDATPRMLGGFCAPARSWRCAICQGRPEAGGRTWCEPGPWCSDLTVLPRCDTARSHVTRLCHQRCVSSEAA